MLVWGISTPSANWTEAFDFWHLTNVVIRKIMSLWKYNFHINYQINKLWTFKIGLICPWKYIIVLYCYCINHYVNLWIIWMLPVRPLIYIKLYDIMIYNNIQLMILLRHRIIVSKTYYILICRFTRKSGWLNHIFVR